MVKWYFIQSKQLGDIEFSDDNPNIDPWIKDQCKPELDGKLIMDCWYAKDFGYNMMPNHWIATTNHYFADILKHVMWDKFGEMTESTFRLDDIEAHIEAYSKTLIAKAQYFDKMYKRARKELIEYIDIDEVVNYLKLLCKS